MRDIKFRGKTLKNISFDGKSIAFPKGMWVKGYLVVDEISDKYYIFSKGNSCNETDNIGEDGILHIDTKEVDKNTIGQYTGLKDKNGKEIYEGDILKLPVWLEQDDENEKCICVYAEEHQTSEIIGFGLYLKNAYSGKYQDLVPSDEWDEFEVVGNIYDNPELLKEAKDEI